MPLVGLSQSQCISGADVYICCIILYTIKYRSLTQAIRFIFIIHFNNNRLIKEFISMTAKLLGQLLPIELIDKIQAYQIPVKDSKFVIRWMKRLSNMPVDQTRLPYWKFIVRDSKDLVIQLPMHQLDSFNFAYFVQNFIKNNFKNKYAKCACKYFEEFCINAIKNNPQLLLNRYYVGNGGSPCFEMISSFLFLQSINGTNVITCEQVEDALFNIYLIFMRNQDCIPDQKFYVFFYGFDNGTYKTRYAVQVLKVFFQRFSVYFRNVVFENIDPYDTYYNPRSKIVDFISSVFKKLASSQNYQEQIMRQTQVRYYHISTVSQEDIKHTCTLRRRKIEEFLCWFQDKQAAILEKYKHWIVQQTFKHLTLKALQSVMALPGFRSLVFSKEYVFHLVESRKFKLFRLLWSVEEQRGKLCSFKSNGRNILETAAENRGLSHNFIDLLWASKSFETLPNIKNQKSKSIIHQRYGIKQEEQSMV